MHKITANIKLYPHRMPALFGFLLIFMMPACKDKESKKPPEVVVVAAPEKADEKVSDLIKTSLEYLLSNKGKLNDSTLLKYGNLLDTIYNSGHFEPLWSSNEQWNSLADSLYAFITEAKLRGLFPNDYHLSSLNGLRKNMLADSLHKKNAVLWARADILFTDAYFGLAKDLCLGRLNRDSATLRNDSLFNTEFFVKHFQEARASKRIPAMLTALEPKYKGYEDLKAAIPFFLDSNEFTPATYIVYPTKDSVQLIKQVAKRLNELGVEVAANDTSSMKEGIKKYQKQHGIPVTGKIGEKTTSSLNNTAWQKFKRIAVTLDRYKQLPDTLPRQYIWVNLPGFYLQLWDADTLALESKVVVGKPYTRTPVLSSKITDMVTYPQWTIPNSIIVKEILPGLKRDPNYLARKGFSLVDSKGDDVSPSTVNWSKYSKGIPYRVVQGSGDDNALGVLKFNFSNKYAVYLHDTNQRYYFSRGFRALSHGCVRVQQWNKLAYFIIANDSLNAAPGVNTFKSDSLASWLARKEKHIIPVRTRLPVYIRYFSCAGIDGKVKFYDDMYNEDKLLVERYFANKLVN